MEGGCDKNDGDETDSTDKRSKLPAKRKHSQVNYHLQQQYHLVSYPGRYPPPRGDYPPALYPSHQGDYVPTMYAPHPGSYHTVGYPPQLGEGIYFHGNPQASHPESSAPEGSEKEEGDPSMKSEEKKQIRWNASMDNILLDTLGDAVREGKKYGRKWDPSVMKKLLEVLSENTKEQVKSMHIENRLRQMRTEYLNFKELRKKCGSTFDHVKDAIVLSADVWKSILENPKEKKKWGVFKERGPKWDYEKLSMVLGNYHATGSYSFNGLDDIETINIEEEHTDDLPSMKEKVDLEEGEESASCASTKNITSSQSKRQRGKKSKAFDEMKDMLSCVNSNLEKLRESVDPLHYGKLLRKAVDEVKDFSEKYLDAAFKILMKNRVDGEIFILTKEEGRKDILIEMREQIGNL